MKKIYFVMIILFGIILTACQESNQTQSNMSSTQSEQADQNNESSYHSHGDPSANSNEDHVVPNEKDMNDKTGISGSHSPNQDRSLVKEETYSSEKEAVNAIENYYEIEQTNLDLGHGIKGFAEGAAGHHYISWNEGKWLIEINFPTNPEYAIDNYENAESMAKSTVNYLDEHFLPPPDQRGKIQINGFREHPETIIRWQQGNKVYEIDQKTANPLEALQIAVDQRRGA
ncbi:hypothetical protein ACNQFZ_20340 [Schinkia sp. CFF1]